MTVEFNKIVSAMLGCNTNVSILGSEEQAKSTLCYILKYVTKPPTEITHSISLIHHVRQTIEEHPSVAEDSGTEKRTAMHLLNGVTNQISSTIEVSSSFASLAILGISNYKFHIGFNLNFKTINKCRRTGRIFVMLIFSGVRS